MEQKLLKEFEQNLLALGRNINNQKIYWIIYGRLQAFASVDLLFKLNLNLLLRLHREAPIVKKLIA